MPHWGEVTAPVGAVELDKLGVGYDLVQMTTAS